MLCDEDVPFQQNFFRRRTVFEFTEAAEIERVFGESDPLKEVLKFRYETFTRIRIHVSVPSFVKIHKAEVTKTMRGIPHKKV